MAGLLQSLFFVLVVLVNLAVGYWWVPLFLEGRYTARAVSAYRRIYGLAAVLLGIAVVSFGIDIWVDPVGNGPRGLLPDLLRTLPLRVVTDAAFGSGLVVYLCAGAALWLFDREESEQSE